MTSYQFIVDESDRQALVLALAILALQRPGWDHYLRTIAVTLGDAECAMFLGFKDANRDVVKPV